MFKTLAFSLVAALLLVTTTGCKGDPSTPEYWGKAFEKSPKVKDRVRVAEDLRASGKVTQAFLPMLHDQLSKDKSSEVKASVAKILAVTKSPDSVEPLINSIDLGNTEPAANNMNKEITSALAAIGDQRAVPQLMKMINAKDNYVKIEAINGLGALKAKQAVEKLTSIATDENGEPFIAKKAIQALGEIGDPTAVPALTRMMFKERRGVSFYVESSFALYQIGDKSADAMLPIVEGKDKDLIAWANTAGLMEAALYAKAMQVVGDLHDKRAEKAIIQKARYENQMLDIKLFVRMRAADALGRMRSEDGAKVLASMLDEPEANARAEYIRALVKIGDKSTAPALTKSALEGSWDAREQAIKGLSLIGDEKSLADFAKIEAEDEKLFTAECKEDPDYPPCKDIPGNVKKHKEVIAGHKKRLDAYKDCKADTACWVKKLDDADAGVRERAALELGRSGKADAVEPLMKHLKESNLDTRLAMIQGLDWLLDDKAAAAKAKPMQEELEKQVADEKGKTEFVKVNEDLRRLSVKLKRS